MRDGLVAAVGKGQQLTAYAAGQLEVRGSRERRKGGANRRQVQLGGKCHRG